MGICYDSLCERKKDFKLDCDFNNSKDLLKFIQKIILLLKNKTINNIKINLSIIYFDNAEDNIKFNEYR